MLAVSSDVLASALLERDELVVAQADAGLPLHEILEGLLLTAEVAAGGAMVTSVLILDQTGRHLRHGAAPNLPDRYCEAIDGIAIGPNVGSCGTAAFLGEPVYAFDTQSDPRWADFRELAAEHGLRACWSTPIKSSAGAVIGTFAVYNHTSRSPTEEELGAIDLIARSVAAAITTSPR